MSSLAAPALETTAESSSLRVWTLSKADKGRWDRFVDACPEATFFHRAGWRDVPLASVLTFFFRDEVVPYYGGGNAEARAYKANDFMYWDVMKRAAERGFRVFDYGRSKVGTGSYSFKKNWGFDPEPLPYQYRLVQASEMPNVSPANPKYRLMVEAWRRLPVSVSKILGPLVSRNLA